MKGAELSALRVSVLPQQEIARLAERRHRSDCQAKTTKRKALARSRSKRANR